MSIHDSEPKKIFTRGKDGKIIESMTEVDPHRYLPIFLAMMGWLQEVTLDDVTNIWWRAQKMRNNKIKPTYRRETENEP